ncbi:MAG: Rossmann-like and DUF2520 domain-containing protein [Bacteroidota bacterium]
MEYKISFIGAGRVAWHLSQAFTKAGFTIFEVYSRNKSSALKVTNKIKQGKPTNKTDLSGSEANIFIIAVPDDIIAEIPNTIVFPKNSLILHTSGTVPLSILSTHFYRTGILYPLQTFSFDRQVHFENIPVCIEASDTQSLEVIKLISQSISDHVYEMNSEKRRKLHLAAVFACNFTNYLFTLSKEILTKERIAFDILANLVKETTEKAFEIGPESAQTGPAYRKDFNTISAHLKVLSEEKNKKEIYELLTKNIVEKYKK